ncbi:MAG: hypothetical protein ACTSRW_06105 [Candidatus Helarchaeota archaeon]
MTMNKKILLKGSIAGLLCFMLAFGFMSVVIARPGCAPSDSEIPEWNLRWEGDLLTEASTVLGIALPTILDLTFWGQIWTQNETVNPDELAAVAFTVTSDLQFSFWDIQVPTLLTPLVRRIIPEFTGGSIWNVANSAFNKAVTALNSTTNRGTWTIVDSVTFIPGLDHVLAVELESTEINATFVLGTSDSVVIMGIALNVSQYEQGDFGSLGTLSLDQLANLTLTEVIDYLIEPVIANANLTSLFGALTGLDFLGGGFGAFSFGSFFSSNVAEPITLSSKASGSDVADSQTIATLEGLMGTALSQAELFDLIVAGIIMAIPMVAIVAASAMALKGKD